MLQNAEEVRKADGTPAMLNEVDNPNLMSVDSTEVRETVVDELPSDEEKEVPKEVPPVVAKDQKPVEEVVVPVKTEKKPDGEVIPFVKGADKRIGEITKKWRTTERERDFLQTKLTESEAKIKELSAKVPSEDKPRKEDFDEEAEFLEALTDWKIDVKLKASREEVAASVESVSEKKAVEKVYDTLDSVMEKGRAKYEDFIDLVQNEDLVLSPETAEIALLADNPEDVLYYLAAHSEESAELATLPPAKIAIKIGAISAKLEVKPVVEPVVEPVVKPVVTPPVKKQSNAPEPIEPVRTEGLTERDPSKMTPKEYRAWRERNKE